MFPGPILVLSKLVLLFSLVVSLCHIVINQAEAGVH